MDAQTLLMTRTSPLPQTTQKTTGSLHREALSLLRTEIGFIPNAEFHRNATSDSAFVGRTLTQLENSKGLTGDVPAHFSGLCRYDLLSQEQETALFREMNYLRYQANSLRSRIDPDDADPDLIAAIHALLQRAEAVRDTIIRANLRLVMSVVKRFVTPQQSFDDLLSEGILTLMQTVDKFDYDRGFRFSTYAYRSIARAAYRYVTAARIEEARFARDAVDWADAQQSERNLSAMTDQVWNNLRELMAKLIDKLDRRERFILRGRYALGAHRKVRTFQDLANRLGVSKERVRQLEQRAVAKLQRMAAEFETDDLFDAAMM